MSLHDMKNKISIGIIIFGALTAALFIFADFIGLCSHYLAIIGSLRFNARFEQARRVDIICFTYATEFTLHISAFFRQQTANQRRQLQKILRPEHCSARRHSNERIGRDDIGPTGRYCGELLFFVVEVDPVLTPRALVSDQLELAIVPRVEGMSDAEGSRRNVALRRSCQGRPMLMRSDSSGASRKVVWSG